MRDYSIEGYTFTNSKGKMLIKGYYNPLNKTITFREIGKDFSNSKEDKSAFYFIKGDGIKTKQTTENVLIRGGYKGIYPSEEIAAIGNIILLDNILIRERELTIRTIRRIKGRPLSSLIKTVEDTTTIKKELKILPAEKPIIKPEPKPVPEHTNLVLKSDEKIFVECSKQDLRLDLWDGSIFDGDSISIFLNDKALLENIILTKEIKTIKITPPADVFTIKIVAVNLGAIGANTVSFELKNKFSSKPFFSQLNKGEYFHMEFHMKKKTVNVRLEKAK